MLLNEIEALKVSPNNVSSDILKATTGVDNILDATYRECLRNRIKAVKFARDKTGWDLRTSKDFADDMIRVLCGKKYLEFACINFQHSI
jgi:hypothetical protein